MIYDSRSVETIYDDRLVETIYGDRSGKTTCDELVAVDSTLDLLRINADVGTHTLRPCST